MKVLINVKWHQLKHSAMTPCKVRQNAKKSLMAAAQQAVMKEDGLGVTVATSKGTKQEKKKLGDEKKEGEE